MALNDAKQKLALLGEKVQGRKLTSLEEAQIGLAAVTKPIKAKSDVRKALAEALNITEDRVTIRLGSSDDTDRLLDDVVNLLGKPK